MIGHIFLVAKLNIMPHKLLDYVIILLIAYLRSKVTCLFAAINEAGESFFVLVSQTSGMA
jgi:hypothetical protein